MKYCRSSDFSAAAARRTRTAKAAWGSGSAWIPALPGFAVTLGPTARPSRVAAVSARAKVAVRPSSGGRLAQPVINDANTTATNDSIRLIPTGSADNRISRCRRYDFSDRRTIQCDQRAPGVGPTTWRTGAGAVVPVLVL